MWWSCNCYCKWNMLTSRGTWLTQMYPSAPCSSMTRCFETKDQAKESHIDSNVRTSTCTFPHIPFSLLLCKAVCWTEGRSETRMLVWLNSKFVWEALTKALKKKKKQWWPQRFIPANKAEETQLFSLKGRYHILLFPQLSLVCRDVGNAALTDS